MIAVIQRVSQAEVRVDEEVTGKIGTGLLVLLGVAPEDTQADVEWLAAKIVAMRIFADEEGKMNRSLAEVQGQLLVVSQFTLHASTKKGNRPSFIGAAKPDIAVPLYESFCAECQRLTGQTPQTGRFGADMQVSLLNDGPVTLIIDTQNKR